MGEPKKCPKCSGNMEQGELVDQSYAVSGAQHWAESAASLLGIGVSGDVKIISYRCFDCGYLENYAPSEKRKKYNNSSYREKVSKYEEERAKVLGKSKNPDWVKFG